MIAAGLEVLEACAARDGGFALDVSDSTGARSATSAWRDDAGRRPRTSCARFDAIYFGAVGAPDVPDHISLWGLRLAICQPLDQYANVRPIRILPGIASPLRNVAAEELDWVIVRENSEGEYAGQGGRSHRGLPHEVATEVAIFTRAGVTRIMRFAFELARSRPRKLLDGGHQVQRAALRPGDVGRDRGRGGQRISRRHLGQDAGRRHDHAHDAQARDAGHDRRDQPARRHPVRSRCSAGRLAGDRTDGQPQSRAYARPRCSSRSTARPSTLPARASPTRRQLLDRGDDARASGRARRPPAA